MVKRRPVTQEIWVPSLGLENPLEKEMATHYSTLAWKNTMDGRAWWATVQRVAKSQTQLSNFIDFYTLLQDPILSQMGDHHAYHSHWQNDYQIHV